jgi:hypothetical protein
MSPLRGFGFGAAIAVIKMSRFRRSFLITNLTFLIQAVFKRIEDAVEIEAHTRTRVSAQ